MGRAGILFSHVAMAAAQLAADGKNPTVDNVREALGGTGSKSTIAPMLKRWKAEQDDASIQVGTGLPAELLTAVKGLYEKIQDEARQTIAEAQRSCDTALQAAADGMRQATQRAQALEDANSALSGTLQAAQEALVGLHAEHHALTTKIAGLEGENTGLQQRLADRAAEVTALNHQLVQGGKQFEHFQEAAAAQRLEERRATDQRIARLERDNTALQRQLMDSQRSTVLQVKQIADLTDDAARLQAAARETIEQMALVHTERDQLTYQVRELTSARLELRGELAAVQQLLVNTRSALARQEKETEILTERLGGEQQRIVALEAERLSLVQDNATLRANLESDRKTNDTGLS